MQTTDFVKMGRLLVLQLAFRVFLEYMESNQMNLLQTGGITVAKACYN